MSQVGDIIEGHLNELRDKNKSLKDMRLEICSKCPLAKQTVMGIICDSSKWMNENREVVTKKTFGYTRGCGCRMTAKASVEHAKCVTQQW